MEFILVTCIIAVIVLAILYIKERRKKPQVIVKTIEKEKVVEVIKEVEKVDTPPETQDVIILASSKEPTKITKDNLVFKDVDGDKITHVKFTGSNTTLFFDKKFTKPYRSNRVLPIDFILYIKPSKNLEEISLKYFVKSNNKWSCQK